jgi:hypothetical protein
MNPAEMDLDAAVALCELRRDGLYRQLLGQEDEHRRVHPGLVPRRRAALEFAVAHNPLARAIVDRAILHSPHPRLTRSPFNGRPVTCFGVHEVLRHTRFHRDFADGGSPGVLTLGGERVIHDQLLAWLGELVPNLNLARVYNRSFLLENPAVAPVLAGIVIGGIVATDTDPGQWHQPLVAGGLGAGVCGAVLFALQRAKYGRKLTHTAPWHATLHVDINLALLRDHPEHLHLGCRALIPRPRIAGWKFKSRYYPLALGIPTGDYHAPLAARAAG